MTLSSGRYRNPQQQWQTWAYQAQLAMESCSTMHWQLSWSWTLGMDINSQKAHEERLASVVAITSGAPAEADASRSFRLFLGPMAARAVRLASFCRIMASSCCCIWRTPPRASRERALKTHGEHREQRGAGPGLALGLPPWPSVWGAAALGPPAVPETAGQKRRVTVCGSEFTGWQKTSYKPFTPKSGGFTLDSLSTWIPTRCYTSPN